MSDQDQNPPEPQHGQPSPGTQFNPQSGTPTGDAPTPQYGQPPYGQPPYGQPPYGYQGYPVYVPPTHSRATTALILGLVSTVGAFLCLLPALAGPFAWITAVRARREIRESQGRLGGESAATAGLILGIIGTVLLALMLIGLIGLIVWASMFEATFNDAFDDGTRV